MIVLVFSVIGSCCDNCVICVGFKLLFICRVVRLRVVNCWMLLILIDICFKLLVEILVVSVSFSWW